MNPVTPNFEVNGNPLDGMVVDGMVVRPSHEGNRTPITLIQTWECDACVLAIPTPKDLIQDPNAH